MQGKNSIRRGIQSQKDILWALQLDLKRRQYEAFRMEERGRTNANTIQLNATIADCYQEEKRRTKKQCKAYKVEAASRSRELGSRKGIETADRLLHEINPSSS